MAAKHPFAAITFDSVVYLGAGYGDNLDELLTQINANHWHLVEGDTKKHKPLQKTINALQNSDKVTLHKHVVSDDGTTKTWYSYNLDEFSGLKKAKELDQLFPGLKLKQEKNVDTQALPDFLRQLELSSKENNLLIIDLPGQALELIESILKAGQKPLFSQMVLTATTEQAFEQGGTLERIKQWLDKQGYHTRNEPYDDPDFPVLYYSFDKHSAAEFAKLKREVKQRTKERDEALARASGTSKELEQIKKERDEAVARASGTSKELEQIKQQLNEKSEQTNQAQSKIKELEESLTQANKEKQKHIDLVHKLEVQLEETEKAKDNVEARLLAAHKELEQLKQQLKDTAELANKADTQYKKIIMELNQTKDSLNAERQLVEKQSAQVVDLKKQFGECKESQNKLIKEAESKDSDLKKLNHNNEALATENLRLITKNSDLTKQNEILADSVRRIEIQMDLLKELLQRD